MTKVDKIASESKDEHLHTPIQRFGLDFSLVAKCRSLSHAAIRTRQPNTRRSPAGRPGCGSTKVRGRVHS